MTDNSNNWRGFKGHKWQEEIDVRDFIIQNFTPYEGNDSFLVGPTDRTKKAVSVADVYYAKERENGGVYKIDTQHISSVNDEFDPGYLLDKDEEIIVGLQTDEPLKRAINPFGGLRMAKTACEAYGYEFPKHIEEDFKYRTTHNDGVFKMYTKEMRKARHMGLLTGLPDAYGRGRIIGDYRRVALYGIDYLIEQKEKDIDEFSERPMSEDNMRLLGELRRQVEALKFVLGIARKYGYDISKPANNAHEAFQWLYFGYLGAIKTQNGAAMSLGRVSTFLDIYIERDIKEGTLDEVGAQELFDDFVLHLRLARHLRTPEYNELFAGDPMWITEAIGGMALDGRTLVTKSCYRMLNTLNNLKASPEPNMTILYSVNLPENFKKFCAAMSIKTDAIQYENDDVMREYYGDDYAIACCVSAMKIGKQMQFFGARCNLPKVLLLALNGGYDVKSDTHIGPQMGPCAGDILDYEKVMKRVDGYLNYLANLYVKTMNVIHYSHDIYAYERVEMSLHDSEVERMMAFGVAGLSVMADSLSAIKYAQVKPIRNEDGYIVGFETIGDFPKFGNDDDRVDEIAQMITHKTIKALRQTPCYRNATHTLSVLTITSNVMYGLKTASTPDGRKSGQPFAPGANPMHNREKHGALASLNSISKLKYSDCRDGISNTFSITPNTLGKDENTRVNNLVSILDGYFSKGAHHINVNVLNREVLIDAMDHPEKYPNLTIRVSGYAVNFNKLSRKHQEEVISRTFHESI